MVRNEQQLQQMTFNELCNEVLRIAVANFNQFNFAVSELKNRVEEDGVANEKKFYLVWCENRGLPNCKHKTEQSANKEAERLARLHADHKFHVLGHIDTCQMDDVVWDSLDFEED